MMRMRIAEGGLRNVQCRVRSVLRRVALRAFIPKSEIRNLKSKRSAISLIEILISMFVLLFGLMGVAAIFPVGNHYVVEGEKFDLGSALAQNAFEELKARDVLRPELWLYAAEPIGRDLNNALFIQDTNNPGFFNVPLPTTAGNPHPGHAFVMDPLGTANTGVGLGDYWPFDDFAGNTMPTAWSDSMNAANVIPGNTWPVRRMTLPQAGGFPLTTEVAETIFRLRDDLAVEMPEQDDRPSIQRWNVDGGGALLSRQYQGNYSWLATVVPSDAQALKSLQPEDPMRDEKATYDVSVVVFRGRDETPSANSERLIRAELVSQSELVIYDDTAALVDAAVDDIRPGNWIVLMGVHPTTGKFMMKWYRLLALDNDTVPEVDPISGNTNYDVKSDTGNFYLRFAMFAEPSWPLNAFTNLRAVLMPGTISAVTHQMKMQE